MAVKELYINEILDLFVLPDGIRKLLQNHFENSPYSEIAKLKERILLRKRNLPSFRKYNIGGVCKNCLWVNTRYKYEDFMYCPKCGAKGSYIQLWIEMKEEDDGE